MATLDRPDVKVEQAITTESPTVIAPVLTPCAVGPCYAIVEPLDSSGMPNSDAEVSTPAIIKSASSLGDVVAVASEILAITVDDNDIVIVTLPAVASGSNLSTAMLPEYIQSKVPGLDVDLVEDKLVFETNTTGASSRLRLHSKADLIANSVPGIDAGTVMAYADLALDTQLDEDIYGQGPYKNKTYTVPYAKLPTYSFHPDGSELVFDSEEIDVYLKWLGSFRKLSATGAINWSSSLSGATKINNQTPSFGASENFYSSVLYAKQSASAKTNRLFDAGKDASVYIPLERAIHTVDSTTPFPDASGQFYLYAEAKGSQDFLANQSASCGAYAGTAGNAITIDFTSGGSELVSVVSTAVTIQYQAGTATYDDIAAAITAAATDLAPLFHRFEFVYPAANGTDTLSATIASEGTFYLSGGIDPMDFSSDGSNTKASIVGTISNDADDPVTILQGKQLSVSVDGAEPVFVVMPSGTQDLATLATDLQAAVPNLLADVVAIHSKHDPSVAAGSGLRLRADGANDGHDSTLEIGGDTEVIRELFNGWTSKTEILSSIAPFSNDIEGVLAAGALGDYNKTAVTALELSLVPGTVELALDDVLMKGHALSYSSTQPAAADYLLTLSHSAFTPYYVVQVDMDVTGYENIATSDLGKPVVGSSTGDSGVLRAYSNSLKKWWIEPDDYLTDEFDTNELVTITGGTALTTTKITGSSNVLSGGNQGDKFTIMISPSDATSAEWADGTLPNRGINDGLSVVNNLAKTDTADSFITAKAIELAENGSATHLAIFDAKTTADAIVKLYGTTTGDTTAALQTGLEGSGSGATTMFDINLRTQYMDVVMHDDISNSDLPAYLELPVTTYPPAGWNYLSPSLTEVSYVGYDDGDIKYYLDPDLFWGDASYSRSLTYTRGAASYVDRAVQDYGSRVWTGQSTKVVSGDRMFSGGDVLASVVKTENLSVPGAPSSWGTGSVIVLSTEALDNGDELTSWYIRAENLAESGGRAVPEVVFNDITGEFTIKAGLNAGDDGVPTTGQATVYVGYRALRLDVTAQAASPGILLFENTDEVEEQIGPVSIDNPLAFSLYLGFLNAQTSALGALGISEVSAGSPDGTVDAYEEAFELLEQYEVYTIAPLTFNRSVQQLLNSHVSTMSLPDNKKERVGLVCERIPTEKEPTLVTSASGCTITQTSAGVWTLDFGPSVNLTSLLTGKKDANGNTITPGAGVTFTADQGIFIERVGDAYRYLVDKQISTQEVQIRTNYSFDESYGPGTNGNDDGYYYDSDDKLDDFSAAGELCSLFIRNTAISMVNAAGKFSAMEALAAISGGASGYQNRRFVTMGPEYVATDIDGLETVIPGYYACAIIGAMTGQLSPSQGFTNYPIVGLTRPIGSSDKFTEKQLATAAAGGFWWLVQDEEGAPLVTRHQLTTDVTSLKTREYSVTKAIDYMAKSLRITARRYIGRNNITPGLMNTLALVLTGAINRMTGNVVAGAKLVGIVVQEGALDKIAIDVKATPFYPLNEIYIRIVV